VFHALLYILQISDKIVLQFYRFAITLQSSPYKQR